MSFLKSYKERLKTEVKDVANIEINEAVTGINDSTVGYVIPYAMFIVAQTHIWHLLCQSGQKHMALGEFYNELDDEVDSLAERFIAQGGELTKDVDFNLDMEYSDQKVYNVLEVFRNIVSSAVSQTDTPELKSIQDGLVDLQEVIDNKLYKFQRN